MGKRTQVEIDRQIEGLKKMKGTLPEHSVFGGNNWDSIDAMIAVLKGEKKPDYYYQDEHAEEFEESDNEIWSDAERANEWLQGNETEDLFE